MHHRWNETARSPLVYAYDSGCRPVRGTQPSGHSADKRFCLVVGQYLCWLLGQPRAASSTAPLTCLERDILCVDMALKLHGHFGILVHAYLWLVDTCRLQEAGR